MKTPSSREVKSLSPVRPSNDVSITDEPQIQPIPNTPPPKKPLKFKLTVLMICTISVVVALDAVIVAATLPAITVSLKGTSLEAFWVGTSYLLAQTVRQI
jgi:hypothetical protein